MLERESHHHILHPGHLLQKDSIALCAFTSKKFYVLSSIAAVSIKNLVKKKEKLKFYCHGFFFFSEPMLELFALLKIGHKILKKQKTAAHNVSESPSPPPPLNLEERK